MIQLENISRIYTSFGIETNAIQDVNLSINKGEFVAIMGPSGCGKTTLLNIIGLLDSATSGIYKYNGDYVSTFGAKECDAYRKAKIGFVFQSFNLIDELTVAENVGLPLKYRNVGFKERKERVDNVLKELQINHRAGFYPYQLSGGQQQLISIARAIVYRPELIIADEPTGNIDSEKGYNIMEMLTKINVDTGATIIMATHNKRDAAFAHRVINMLDGTIVASASTMG